MNGSPVLGHEDLKLLRPVVRGPVVLGGGEKARIIGESEALHERQDELVGRKAAEALYSGGTMT